MTIHKWMTMQKRITIQKHEAPCETFANKAIEAKKRAKNSWESNLKQKHNDDFSEIKYFEKVEDIHSIKKIKSWEIKLIYDPQKKNEKLFPDWYGYMRIDKK